MAIKKAMMALVKAAAAERESPSSRAEAAEI